jgi:hypothetical protein
MGTVGDQVYELLSHERLSDTNWVSEGTFIGAENQDWTPTTIAVGARTNSLFIWCRSWADEDSDGLPSWWEMQYGLDPHNPDTGNTGVADGDKNSRGDGWSNIYKYEHGMNPTQFYTPPPPQNVTARLNTTGTNIIVTWMSGGGSVAQYRIVSFMSGAWVTNTVSSSNFSFTENAGIDFFADPMSDPSYMVIADFPNGAASASPWVVVDKKDLNRDKIVVRGPAGGRFLTMQSPPAGLSKLRVYWAPEVPNPGDPRYPYFDIDATNILNGVVQLPFDQLNRYPHNTLVVRAICTNGFSQADSFLQLELALEEGTRDYGATNFINAALQMKENLKFLLRSANVTEGFGYASGFRVYPYDDPRPDDPLFNVNDPEYGYKRPPLATNYEYYGFHTYSPNLGYAFLEEGRPIRENFFWRNFAFSTVDITNGTFHTGTETGFSTDAVEWMRGLENPKYVYWGSGTELTPPLVLTNSDFRWTYWFSTIPNETDLLAEAGIFVIGTNLFLPFNVSNIYGLRINSVHFKDNDNQYVTLSRGESLPAPDGSDFFVETENPILQPVGYYFASQSRYIWYGSPLEPVPGSPEFSATNTSRPLITGIGQPITVAGWAKLAVTNGFSGTYAYLEQYWDKAFKTDTNGHATANETGLLSPYGEFFPTEPGPTALRTMPDIDTGDRGTGIVHVIKLQLDVNHDGAMDFTFGGPDNTSLERPFVFWVNDDFDRLHPVGPDREEDDLDKNDRDTDAPFAPRGISDCKYPNGPAYRVIPCPRDLEDFARLWIVGVTSNLVMSLPPGTTGELSWGDKDNPNPNNPTIDLFPAAASGGMAYLTNVNWASDQAKTDFYPCLGTLGPGGSITVLSNGWMTNLKLIWCGAKAGTGTLTLTIRQGTNTLAETSTYIQLTDIKQMYERWTVGDTGSMAPKNKAILASDGLATGATSFQYAPSTDTNTPYILLVHDYDLPPWKKDRYAETAFKRLYWHGYQGRFGLFRWPNVFNLSSHPRDDSEFNAWRSGAGLLNRLTNLNAQYPGHVYLMAHGYGAIAAGEALRLAGTNQVVNTYIAMQGAVASRAYDPSVPFRLIPLPLDDSTPDRYINYYTSGAPCYFSGVGGAGIYINYFNTNDTVLTNDWRSDQDRKPALSLTYSYHWDGTNFSKNFGTPLVFPTNTYEIFSYCDEARSEAIGAQPNLRGRFLTSGQVDLTGAFGFGGTLRWHSMEFLSDCANAWDFWDAVLKSMGIPH